MQEKISLQQRGGEIDLQKSSPQLMAVVANRKRAGKGEKARR